MTLATTCPHCKTSFRVVADQLKLRKGLVRCGRCQQVFSGVDALSYLDEAETVAPVPAPIAPEPQSAPTASEPVAAEAETAAAEPETVVAEQAPVVAEPEPLSAAPESVSAAPQPVSAALEPVSAAPEHPAPAPEQVPDWAMPETSAAASDSRSSVRSGKRVALLAGLAGVCLLGQALIGWRHELAYRAPVVIPLVTQAIAPLGLDLHPPLDAASLSIESIEVASTEDPGTLALEAVIRNRSGRPVAFPAIELTLRDAQSVMLTRKVIPAEIYAPVLERQAGIPARSEWPVQVALKHDGLAVAGYAAVLFHP
jgi:predicted Zn finger-like uncharacterized protein/SLAP domain-containing protein